MMAYPSYNNRNKPLQLWDKRVENGSIKRIADDDVQVGLIILLSLFSSLIPHPWFLLRISQESWN